MSYVVFFVQTDRIEDHGDSCAYKSLQTKLQFIYKYYVQFVHNCLKNTILTCKVCYYWLKSMVNRYFSRHRTGLNLCRIIKQCWDESRRNLARKKRKKKCLSNWLQETFPIVLKHNYCNCIGSTFQLRSRQVQCVARGREFGYDKGRSNGSI